MSVVCSIVRTLTHVTQHATPPRHAHLPRPFSRLLLLVLILLVTRTSGTIGSSAAPTGGDVLDLLQHLNSSMDGLSWTGEGALLLDDPSRQMRLPASTCTAALGMLGGHSDVSFLVTLRQDEGDSGTLVAFSRGNTRVLEIESSGRRDEVRLHYATGSQGVPQVETFPYRLADGAWHDLAVTLTRDHVALYVDCSRIYQRVIRPWNKTGLTSEVMTSEGQAPIDLYVGQRNAQHALFKGALQDVRLTSKSQGFLLQCPATAASEAECPTCAKMQDLEEKVKEMSIKYKDISNQLVKAEERLASLEQCECHHQCVDEEGRSREEGEEWAKDKCSVCRCKNGTIACFQEECPALQCSNPVSRDGECCPVCNSQCLYKGVYYDHGDQHIPTVCVNCECKFGSMICAPVDKEATCPKLTCPEEERIEVHGQCCPLCKNTDFCGQGHDCHSNASCWNMDTKYMCQCHSGFQGDGWQCEDIDECQQMGGKHGHHCGDNTACVNTPGSWRCDCVAGYTRLDNYECTDHLACVDQCHAHAHCVHGNGSFSCVCETGYKGDGVTCEAHCPGQCGNGGKCVGPSVCECRHGYIGPHCEHDIDECALGISRCHGNSICINLPGGYHCDCVGGYHAALADNHDGSLCFDLNECVGEGEGATCHPSQECVNTPGGYMCTCVGGGCHASCISEGDEHANGSVWTSPHGKCEECHCEGGRTECKRTQCDCHDPRVDLDCCPHCDSTLTCAHQEFTKHIQNGDTWFYQCMTCECLHGETDCWPLVCPQLTCNDAVQRPGDCCPVCVDQDPCGQDMESIGKILSAVPCTYNGREYGYGDAWSLEAEPCSTCTCKAGHICCNFTGTCTR